MNSGGNMGVHRSVLSIYMLSHYSPSFLFLFFFCFCIVMNNFDLYSSTKTRGRDRERKEDCVKEETNSLFLF